MLSKALRFAVSSTKTSQYSGALTVEGRMRVVHKLVAMIEDTLLALYSVGFVWVRDFRVEILILGCGVRARSGMQI